MLLPVPLRLSTAVRSLLRASGGISRITVKIAASENVASDAVDEPAPDAVDEPAPIIYRTYMISVISLAPRLVSPQDTRFDFNDQMTFEMAQN